MHHNRKGVWMNRIRMVFFLLLCMFISSCAATKKITSTASYLMASEAVLPEGAKISLLKGDKIKIIGVKPVVVVIYDHTGGAIAPAYIQSRNIFILNPGQGFNFRFILPDESMEKVLALTGEEYIWGSPLWLGDGLVVLLTTSGPQIFIISQLPKQLQDKIKNKERINPLR